MTSFFSAPDAASETSARSIYSVDDADQPDIRSAIAPFDSAEFDMLLRAVELVAQSQAFTPLGLQHALRLTPKLATRLTLALQLIAVITPRSGAAAQCFFVTQTTVSISKGQAPRHDIQARIVPSG